jgi:WD40 repeat protein
MSHCTLPISLINGNFLGSKDRIIVAGNSPSSNIGIQYIVKDINTGESYFQNKFELSFSGICTGVEICGVSRLAKSFVAVANTASNGSGKSSIELVNVEADVEEAYMKHEQSLQSTSGSAYTSLSFYGDQELLAGATDAGDVILWDLYTGKELRRFCADSCGVNKIEFTRSGQLLSSGMSSSAQLYIWDIRTQNTTPSLSSSPISDIQVDVAPIRKFQHPNEVSQNSYYTSISSQSIYNKIICGTSKGTIGKKCILHIFVYAYMSY